MRLVLIATLALASAPVSEVFAQRNLNPIGNGGNILRPGIPLTGSAASPARAVAPAGRSGGRRSFGGGTMVVPYPVYTDPFYSGSTVHNPPPGNNIFISSLPRIPPTNGTAGEQGCGNRTKAGR